MAHGWAAMGVLQCPYLQLSRISAPYHPFHPGEDGGDLTSRNMGPGQLGSPRHRTCAHACMCVCLGSHVYAVTHIC